MKKRLDALTRLGKLQALMHDLGRWRLSAIEQEQTSLNEDLRAVFEALQSGDLAYGAQVKLSARHIRTLQRQLDLLAREFDPCAREGEGARRDRQARRTGRRNRGAALSRRQGAQGARRPHRARHRAPPRKLDVRLRSGGWRERSPSPQPSPASGRGGEALLPLRGRRWTREARPDEGGRDG